MDGLSGDFGKRDENDESNNIFAKRLKADLSELYEEKVAKTLTMAVNRK